MSNTLQSMSSFIRISSGRLFRFPVNKSNLLILVCTVDILYGSLYLMESIDNLIIFRVVFTFYPHSNISWLILRFLALHFPFCFLQISICSSVSFFVRVSVVWMFSLCKCLTNFPVSEFYGQTFQPPLPFLSQFPWRFPRHVSMFFSSRIFQSVTFTCLLSLLSSISRTENPSYLCQSPLDFFSSDRHTISHCSTCLQKIKIIDFTRSCSIFILFLLVRPVCSRRVPYDVFLMMTPTVFCCVFNHVVLLHVHTDRKFSKMKIVRISLIHAVEWDPHNVDLNFCYTQ